MSKKSYDAKSIRVLEGLEPVRLRPGMYTRTENPNHIIQEAIDNAQDEVLAGFASAISVEYHEDGSVSVEDNGRGIPVDIHPEKKIPAVEAIFTILHSGGKFNKDEEDSAYTFSGGLHGVGVSVTNALSSRLDVTIWRDGYEHTIGFADGAIVSPLKRSKLPTAEKGRTGTRIHAHPDQKFFEHPLNVQEMERYLRTKGVLLSGARVSWTRPGRPATVWEFPGGLPQYLEEQSDGDHEWVAPVFEARLYHDGSQTGFRRGEGFELALAFSPEGRVVRESYVNLIPTPQGGRHESGLRAGMVEAVRVVADRMGAVPKGLKIEPEDVWSRMSFLLSTKLVDVEFQNQTKDKMTAEKGQRLVAGLLSDAMELWLNDHPQHATAIVGLIVSEAQRRSRQAVKTDRKRGSTAAMLPGKLSDCESRDVDRTELFIVEGDSAGGCFVGSTLVPLLNGQQLTLMEIAEQQRAGQRHFGYTIKNDGSIGVSEFINARLTKHAAELVKVVLDDGQEIVCTPDHPFMLRDGTYLPAQELASDTPLMPLYRRSRPIPNLGSRRRFAKAKSGLSGYEQVNNPATGRWVFTHILSDAYNEAAGVYDRSWRGVDFHRHHVDFNKSNNDPTNIRRMLPDDHLELHRQMAHLTIHAPAVKEKSTKTKRTAAFRAKQSARMKEPDTRAILSSQATAQWSDPAYRQYMLEAWRRHYEDSPEYRALNRGQLDRAQREYWAQESNRLAQSERTKLFFEHNPDHRAAHRELANRQWQDARMRRWRSKETSRQWTDDFREKRALAMSRQYYNRTMKPLKDVYRATGTVDQLAYDQVRREAGDRYAMRLPKFLDRYFEGSMERLMEALDAYNHRVVRVERLDRREDVYDLEVPGTHNFALAAGVFVHNSGKQGRDKSTQAILPIRGKLLNTWEVESHKALESETVRDISQAIGVDAHPGKSAADVDLSRLRYGRIFIMADADVDGAHIQVLLLTLFLRHFPALIEKGHIWIARAPLYRVDAPAKKGSKAPRKEYALNAEELEAIRKKLGKEGVAEDKIVVSRFKGLGEMNPEQLWETTMNPDSRRPVQIRVTDAKQAKTAFELMMVKKNAGQRREWMEAEGHLVTADI